MHERLLVVGVEWRLRALLRAQLLEDGYDVTALGIWDEAELLLRTRALLPDAVVFDLPGEPNPEAALQTLARLVPFDRALILTSSDTLAPDRIAALGFTHVLARPFQIRTIVEAVSRLLGEMRA